MDRIHLVSSKKPVRTLPLHPEPISKTRGIFSGTAVSYQRHQQSYLNAFASHSLAAHEHVLNLARNEFYLLRAGQAYDFLLDRDHIRAAEMLSIVATIHPDGLSATSLHRRKKPSRHHILQTLEDYIDRLTAISNLILARINQQAADDANLAA